MLDILYLLIVGVLGVFFVGYMSVKFAIWGSITTGIIWMIAHLMPAFTPEEVLAEMGPHILDLFFVYPKAVGMSHAAMTADYGLLGGVATVIWATILLVPYLSGLWLAVVTWPELIIFRIFL